jgi:hypothetical protein
MSAIHGFQQFARGLQAEDQPLIAPERFAAAFHLRQQDLAELAHVHRATVSAAPANIKLQHFMRDTLRVLSAAMEINPDQAQAMYWYKNSPIPEFQHLTSEQLVSAGKTEAVVSYLLSIASGSTG